MKMKQILTLVAFISSSFQIIAQNKTEALVKEGIQYHDQGDYEKAIETYKKALKIEPKSSLVNYELAMSYFSKGDSKMAIKHADVVLDQKGESMILAYVIKGSALDELGKTKESIKLFQKAIKKEGDHYLLYYNLAVNHYRINEIDEAEKYFISALENNSNHASSHFLLTNIHLVKNNPVQTLLAAHYFLFLEPNTNRSVDALKIINQTFEGSVSKDKENAYNLNIQLNASLDNEFSMEELTISMIQATKFSDEQKDKTKEEWFLESTSSFFNIIGANENKGKSIWRVFYIPFYKDLANSPHLQTYCNYILQSTSEDARSWLDQNEAKLVAFDDWLKGN